MALSEAKKELLAQRLAGKAGALKKPADHSVISRRPDTGPAPISPGQRGMWILQQAHPESAVYNFTHSFHVRGRLDLARLERAANVVVRRHEILRSTFEDHGDSSLQVVHDDFRLAIEKLEVEGDPSKRAHEEGRKPLDLSERPPIRLMFVSGNTDEPPLLLLLLHHLIFDKWSLGIFWSELCAAWAAEEGEGPGLDDLSVQFADFAHWHRAFLASEAGARQLDYWKDRLREPPDPLLLPTDFPRRSGNSHAGALESLTFDGTHARELKALAAAGDASFFMVMLLGFAIFLRRYTDEEDIIVGSPVANRRQEETTDMIGMFLITVAIRTGISGDPTVREALVCVREAVLGALENQDVPFDRVVEAVNPPRAPGQNPLFSTMFVHQREEEVDPEIRIPGGPFEMFHLDKHASEFDLTLLTAERGGGLEAVFEYRTELFRPETIRRMLGHLGNILSSMTRDPEARLSELEILSKAEQGELLREWQGTPVAGGEPEPVVETIARQAKTAPQSIAVVGGGQALTYGELHSRAGALAAELQRCGVKPGARVALFLERGPEAIVAIAGILYAGGAYVPVDPAYPEARRSQILEDCGAGFAVTVAANRGLLAGAPAEIVCVDEFENGGSLPQATGVPMDSPAYVIYTSGSTGLPKGVVVSHANLAHSTAARAAFYPEPPGRFLLVPSLSFDSSVAGIFWTLCSGGTLVPVPGDLAQDVDGLAKLIAREAVTHLLCLPSLYELILQYADAAQLASLRTVIVAGERCPAALGARHRDLLPDAALYNEYGPTEGTVWCTAHRVTPDGDPVPIGRPIPGTQVYVLDENRRLTVPGATGELYIGGPGVATGYLGRPEATAERFVPDPFDENAGARLYRTGDLARHLPNGDIVFHGRADGQLKIRGYRIEPGEIEEVLRDHPAVADAAVLVEEAGDLEERLIQRLESLDPAEMEEILRKVETPESEF